MLKEISVMGRKWDTARPVFFGMPEGLSLESVVLSAIERAYRERVYARAQYRSLLRYARCRVDGIEIPRKNWATTFPRAGARVEILHGVRGGGGGGGKSGGILAAVVGAILIAVSVAVSVIAPATAPFMAYVTKAGIGMMISGGLALVSSLLFPQAKPNFRLPNHDVEKISTTYSISGNKNTANVNGYVPLVCGRHRMTPPLGGRSWTVWEGEKQFFHMLVVWGHPDVTVSDFRIGETPLSDFRGVEHAFHQSTTGNDLTFFARSYREESVGAVLKSAEGWNTRTVGECEAISLDFAFQRGLVHINAQTGGRQWRTVRVHVQYREKGAEHWRGFGPVAARAYAGGTVTAAAPVFVYAHRNVTRRQSWDSEGGSVTHETVAYSVAVGAEPGGDIRIWPNRSPGVSGCPVSFAVSGGNVVVSVGSGGYSPHPGSSAPVSGATVTLAPPNLKIFANVHGPVTAGSGDAQIFPTPDGMLPASVTATHYDGHTVTVHVADGMHEHAGYHDFSAATQNLVMRNLRMEGLVRGTYETRCRRMTPDTDSGYIMDECQWSIMRAIVNQPAFSTPVPVCVSELRIRASEQLSGYVDSFNALCCSHIPDWDEASGTWTKKDTANPASIMRYLLTSRHGLNTPYSTAKLDGESLVRLWRHCHDNGHEFNFVCDSEENTWARLVQVLAPGRAAPTTDVDGLWGAVIDCEGKTPVQMFTPRNSWGLSVRRGFAEIPDALRVSFVDEEDKYVRKEGFVYNDGYSADGADGTRRAQNVVEWDFPGVTNWRRVWEHGRYFLATALHRQMTVTLSTDWEWLACRRGDLVGVASDVLMNVFGTARILRLVYRVDGAEVFAARPEEIPLDSNGTPLAPVGVQLDDSLFFSEPAPARYGIAVRSATGALTTHELAPEYGKERETLYFRWPLTAAQAPPPGALCSVSLLGREYDEYLVATLSPQENNVCELTLIPYKAAEIRAASSGAVPPYAESVVMNIVRGSLLPTPVLVAVRSDESVLGGRSGAAIPRIAAWWQLAAGTQDMSRLKVQIVAADVETGEKFSAMADADADHVAVTGVVEGRLYDVRLRTLNPADGVTSAWSPPVRHVCIGRTTPPPPPSAVHLEGHVLRITQRHRPLDVVGHVVSMVFDDTDDMSMGRVLTTPHTVTGTFDLTPWAGRARRVFVQAVDELGLLSAPVSVVVDLGDVLPDNVIFAWSERARNWPGKIVGGGVVHNALQAHTLVTAWAADHAHAAWSAAADDPAWTPGDGAQMSYVWHMVVPLQYAGARVLVVPDVAAGRLLAVEYRRYAEFPAWSFVVSEPAWAAAADEPAWREPEPGAWAALPDAYAVSGREMLDFRVICAAGTAARLHNIRTIIDVPDREWAVEDLAIAANGTTRIPLPPDTFRAVTNVVMSLQYEEGQTAVTLVRVQGSEIVGENGFLSHGPVIRALDANRQTTSASADVRLKGY